jgi:putative membrane protein
MVAQGVWAFEQGVYAGVPLSNFAGWFVSGLVIALAMQVILGPATVPVEAAAARTVFAVQAFLFGLGLALFGLPVAASVGTTAMLAVFVWAVLDARGRRVVAAPRG